MITGRLTRREMAPERDGEHGRDDGEIRERNSEGGQSEKRGDHTERKVRELGRGRRKIIYKNFHFNFFFNERKSDQSDCRIFHDLPIFSQISYFEFSRFVIGQFRSRDRYPSS